MTVTTVDYAYEGRHYGIWVTFHPGTRTGVRDNDFYARNFRVHATKELAQYYRDSFGKGRQPELRFVSFGMRVRHGWEASDFVDVRYIAPNELIKTESNHGEVWRVAVPGRQIGHTVEWLNVMFFPTSSAAELYVTLMKNPYEFRLHRMQIQDSI